MKRVLLLSRVKRSLPEEVLYEEFMSTGRTLVKLLAEPDSDKEAEIFICENFVAPASVKEGITDLAVEEVPGNRRIPSLDVFGEKTWEQMPRVTLVIKDGINIVWLSCDRLEKPGRMVFFGRLSENVASLIKEAFGYPSTNFEVRDVRNNLSAFNSGFLEKTLNRIVSLFS